MCALMKTPATASTVFVVHAWRCHLKSSMAYLQLRSTFQPLLLTWALNDGDTDVHGTAHVWLYHNLRVRKAWRAAASGHVSMKNFT
jgi:hypothetical protein